MNVISTKNLTKTYRRFEKEPGLRGSVKSLFNRKYAEKTAVKSFNLEVAQGELIGLIGPNGAGKTTLVKMLTGIVAPTSGEISVLGYYPNKLENVFKKRYSLVMGQKSQLFFNYTASDTFLLFKELYGVPDDVYKRNINNFTELFAVSHLLNTQIRTLSLGERMKMELIAALLHSPGVLFLDEPTIGLDAAAQRQVRLFLREVNAQNKTTIILTSHYMEDVRSLCPRSIVIGGGEKLYDGETEKLFDAYRTHKIITVTFESETEFKFPAGAEVLEQSTHKVKFKIPKPQSGAALAEVTRLYNPLDIAAEEDDIGVVVERIYQANC
jgi:ABC-2 type transport system ATP-binding protein